MRLSSSMSIVGLSVGAAVLVVAACGGDDGAVGPMGPAGSAGKAGPPGIGVDGGAITGLSAGCLSPCHGFEGVVTQYRTSSHFLAYQELAAEEGPTWTAPGVACGNCHAIDALAQRVGGNVQTAAGGSVANLSTGELQYKHPTTGALATSTYAGNAPTAQVYCTTCHAVTETNDPHRTGIPWTPGSFPLRVPSEASSITIEKSPTNASVTGSLASSPTGSYGTGTTCMWCHRSRVDVTNYLADTNNRLTNVHWGPHEGPQADVFTGVGGYHFPTKAYAQSTHAQRLTCTSCHMVGVAANGNVADHSFQANLAACTSCHAGAKTFDINGGEGQVRAALTEFETWLNTNGWITRNEAAPYSALGASQVGDGNWAHDMPNPTGPITALSRDQAGAFYNYILVARGGAFGVHNPVYARQLLWDSFSALAGRPLASIPTRP